MGSSVISMLVELKNASMAGRTSVEVPYTKFRECLGQLLVKNRHVSGMRKFKKGNFHHLHFDLGEAGTSSWNSLKIISKPGQRIYLPVSTISRFIKKGRRSFIISTSRGLMTISEAAKKRLGGEAICELKG